MLKKPGKTSTLARGIAVPTLARITYWARIACWVGAVLMMATMPVSGACHRYRYWAYKIPQPCRAAALARPMRLPSTRIAIVVPIPRTREEMDIPLPGLAFTPAAEPDALTRLKLFLLMKGREQ
jgi:hypothetical protein